LKSLRRGARLQRQTQERAHVESPALGAGGRATVGDVPKLRGRKGRNWGSMSDRAIARVRASSRPSRSPNYATGFPLSPVTRPANKIDAIFRCECPKAVITAMLEKEGQ